MRKEKKVTPRSWSCNGVGSGVGRAAKQPEVKSTTAASKITAAVMRTQEAADYLGISRTKLHFLHECDPSFPRKIVFSIRCVGYRKDSIDAWLAKKEAGAC